MFTSINANIATTTPADEYCDAIEMHHREHDKLLKLLHAEKVKLNVSLDAVHNEISSSNKVEHLPTACEKLKAILSILASLDQEKSTLTSFAEPLGKENTYHPTTEAMELINSASKTKKILLAYLTFDLKATWHHFSEGLSYTVNELKFLTSLLKEDFQNLNSQFKHIDGLFTANYLSCQSAINWNKRLQDVLEKLLQCSITISALKIINSDKYLNEQQQATISQSNTMSRKIKHSLISLKQKMLFSQHAFNRLEELLQQPDTFQQAVIETSTHLLQQQNIRVDIFFLTELFKKCCGDFAVDIESRENLNHDIMALPLPGAFGRYLAWRYEEEKRPRLSQAAPRLSLS